MPARINLLERQMTEAYDALHARIEGLGEAEFFWQPAPGCWTVHLDEAGRWIADYELPEPHPAPLTTIAWRLVHVATCKVMYHEYAFGPGVLTWDDLEVPHTVAGAVAMLEHGQELLAADLRSVGEAELDELRATNWGDRWPAWEIFWTMAAHDLHHGAEIGALRDLYRLLSPAQD